MVVFEIICYSLLKLCPYLENEALDGSEDGESAGLGAAVRDIGRFILVGGSQPDFRKGAAKVSRHDLYSKLDIEHLPVVFYVINLCRRILDFCLGNPFCCILPFRWTKFQCCRVSPFGGSGSPQFGGAGCPHFGNPGLPILRLRVSSFWDSGSPHFGTPGLPILGLQLSPFWDSGSPHFGTPGLLILGLGVSPFCLLGFRLLRQLSYWK